MKNLFSLKNQTILVTGSLGLIGKEITKSLYDFGANLILTDIHDEDFYIKNYKQKLKNIRGNNNQKILYKQADITNTKSIVELIDFSEKKFNRIDTLINLAGTDAKIDDELNNNLDSFENFPIELWEKSINVNVNGVFKITQSVSKHMKKNRSGNIILTASTYSLVSPNPNLYKDTNSKIKISKPIDYVASKSIIPNYTRYLATHLSKNGIRANYVVPHGIENKNPQWFKDNFAKLSPLNRMCNVNELCGPYVFLASKASSYINGASLVVDGGWTAW
ncbi:MAG: short-chain dehydrogenase [Chloroflexi bacterium]|nr:short-chain dehydrogenase [Chloroflexota bacterium]|tara:strand:+ start:176 stop:1006 length:831 start_codon:yes stop_codon:yes gene_type:complete